MARDDQKYMIDLCDEVLELKASREHSFAFLRGDSSPKFPQGKKLPVDAFYPALKLVIEFEESHHGKPVKLFDKPGVMTVSGTDRAAQRIKYVELRKQILSRHNIRLLFLSINEFEVKGKRLKRIKERDIIVVRNRLLEV